MNSPATPNAGPWFASSRFQAIALCVLVAIAVVEGVVAIGLKDNDFWVHRNFGATFLAGSRDNDQYLPARALMDAPLAMVPYRISRAITYVLALVLLLICYRLWERMAADYFGGAARVGRAAAIFSVFLMLPFLIRDLDECGLQIILLFIMTLAGYALFKGRSGQAGFWLATATSYKITPFMGLPFLLWKRQWGAAVWMVVFLLGWVAAPALVSGWDKNIRDHEQWWGEVSRLKAAHVAYPSLLEREPPKPHNLSLYAVIARYLETYPSEHPLTLNHPWFRQFGSLDPETAYYALQGIILVLGLGFAWKTWRPWKGQNAQNLPGEWASVCAFCALMSPLCWKQHLVMVLPCAFLVMRQLLSLPRPGVWRGALLCLTAVIFYGCRHFVVGRETSIVLLSYKLDTLGMVLLLIWSLKIPRAKSAMGDVKETSTALARAA